MRDGVEDSNAEIRFFNNKVKQMNNKNHPEGEKNKQAGRRLEHSQTFTRRKTTDQPRTADIRRLYRETKEGNEGETAGATETMIK